MEFSPDSNHVIYAGMRENEIIVMIDDREVAHHVDDLSADVAAVDGSRIAYPIPVGDKWAIVCDGQLLRTYDQVSAPTFSQDGSRFAYAAERASRWYVVEDEEESDAFETVMDHSFVFSPDSRRLAFAARIGEHWHAIVDGARSKPYSGVLDRTSVFSPDSKRFAYAAALSPKDIEVVLDRDAVGRHRFVGNGCLAFGQDSVSFAYSARDHPGREQVVLDGVPGPTFDFAADVLPRSIEHGYKRYAGGAQIIFDTIETFHYLAVKSSAFYVVNETMTGGPALHLPVQ